MKLTITIFLLSISTLAQQADSELYEKMKQTDSLVFEVGFNNCDLKMMESLLTSDFEFYHDQAGFQNKETFLTATKNNICERGSGKISRKLIEESLEVFPLKTNDSLYGILARGEHEFFMQEPNQPKRKVGIAKFSNYWEVDNKKWKLKRVFSFDHREAE